MNTNNISPSGPEMEYNEYSDLPTYSDIQHHNFDRTEFASGYYPHHVTLRNSSYHPRISQQPFNYNHPPENHASFPRTTRTQTLRPTSMISDMSRVTLRSPPNPYRELPQINPTRVQTQQIISPLPPLTSNTSTINFDASNDVEALRKALKSSKEDAIIKILCSRNNEQRIVIVKTFKTAFGRDFLDKIGAKTTGSFKKLLIAMLLPRMDFYVRIVYEALSVGNGDVLIEVMCTLTNAEIQEMDKAYQRIHRISLEQEFAKKISSKKFRRMMIALSTGNRDESMATDVTVARADAEALKKGISKWKTDDGVFNRVMCLRNFEQLKLTEQEYVKLSGRSLEQDIKKKFSGDVETGFLAILSVSDGLAEFIAKHLHKALSGISTDDKAVIRLIVSRSDIDIEKIKYAFEKKYEKSLKASIKSNSSGSFKNALYGLIGEVSS